MQTLLLKDPDIYPSDEVLSDVLEDKFPIYKDFIKAITDENYGLSPEWRYYKDGKAWLCKTVYKKKTVLWLSVWDGYFKISLFFTEKTKEGVLNLDISETIKSEFKLSQPTGKLIPLITDITDYEQLNDILKLINYKKSLK